MSKMKDSGVAWLGRIPSHWEMSRIASLYSLRVTKVSDKEYMPLSVTNKGIVPQLETAAKTNAHDDRKLVRKGDFAINSRSDRRGSCGISPYDGSVSLINTILAPRTEMNPRYYDWLFHTVQFGDEFYKWGHGIVDDLWTTGWQEMKKILIPVPPLYEQGVMASFLDKKCSALDRLMAGIQSEIDTLEEYRKSAIIESVTYGLNTKAKLRDSGVFYVGPVNTEWRMTKIGYICSKLTRTFDSTDTALICTNKGTVTERGDSVVGLMSSEDNAMQGIHAGDIAIHGMDTWHGAIALSDVRGKITRVVHVCDSSEDKRYVVYYLQSLAFRGVYKLISNGVRGNTSDFRSWDKVKNIWIPLPSLQEQAQICDRLDQMQGKIRKVIAEKKAQLIELEQYKRSTIYEYVTGKREVPNEV